MHTWKSEYFQEKKSEDKMENFGRERITFLTILGNGNNPRKWDYFRGSFSIGLF